MTRSDDKFAWPKAHPIHAELERWLRAGEPIRYDSLVRATQANQTGDATMTAFGDRRPAASKGDHVIFQYGLVVEDERGRLATFQRIKDGKAGGSRNLRGSSVIVGGSRMMTPSEALPSILADKLSFGRDAKPGDFEPLGFALNRQVPRAGQARADYLFCLHRLRLRGNRLNGQLREDPDTFEWWCPLPELSKGAFDGPIDQLLIRELAKPTPAPHLEGDAWYQPRSRLVDASGNPLEVSPFQVTGSRSVFISHDAAAQLKAFLLRDVLMKRSTQPLFPFLDTHDLFGKSGPFWTRIESMIERSDVFLVLVTEGTARSLGVQREIEYWSRLVPRPEVVVVRVDGNPDDVPELLRSETVLDYTGRAYRTWPTVLGDLVELLEDKPYRVGSESAKDPF